MSVLYGKCYRSFFPDHAVVVDQPRLYIAVTAYERTSIELRWYCARSVQKLCHVEMAHHGTPCIHCCTAPRQRHVAIKVSFCVHRRRIYFRFRSAATECRHVGPTCWGAHAQKSLSTGGKIDGRKRKIPPPVWDKEAKYQHGRVIPRLHDTTGCPTVLTTGWTTG